MRELAFEPSYETDNKTNVSQILATSLANVAKTFNVIYLFLGGLVHYKL